MENEDKNRRGKKGKKRFEERKVGKDENSERNTNKEN